MKQIRSRLPAWQIARGAAVEMGLDHGAEMKLRASLEKIMIVIEVKPDGSADVIGAEKPNAK